MYKMQQMCKTCKMRKMCKRRKMCKMHRVAEVEGPWSGSSAKGRTPDIRYFVAKLSVVAIYALYERPP